MKKLGFKKIMFSLVVFFLWVSLAKAGSDDFASDRILVKFKPEVDKAGKAQINAEEGSREIGEIRGIGVSVIQVSLPAEESVRRFNKKLGKVEFAELDYKVYAIQQLSPSDPYFSQQWGMHNTGQTGGTADADIDAPEAWTQTTGNSAVSIAILDTGIDQDHGDLAGKIVNNMNFTTSANVDDLYGHGTHVAGIAAAATNNSTGVAGVGFNSSLMNGKVLGDDGSGYWSWVANGIIWAADNGAKVINMSLGSSFGSKTVESAINYAWGKGLVLAAAAGNSASALKTYPAAYKNCIAVAATDHKDAIAYFSNWGKNWVDVAAPGVNIVSTLPNHPDKLEQYTGPTEYGSLSGTSMAAPHVAGTTALVIATGITDTNGNGRTNDEVRAKVETTADKIAGTGFYWARGRINAYNAVK